LLVLDGVRMNNAIYRSGHLQNVLTIDPALVERAEIIFGPGSVIYGSDALGGVMHLYTRKPVLSQTGKLESKVRFTSRYGSANQEKHLHADLNLGGEKWGFLSSISLTDFGDLRTGKQWAGEPVFPWLQDSLVQRVEGEDQIVANADPYVFSPTAYRQWDLGQKVLFVPNATTSHELNLQYSTSTDIPRYDRLVQLLDDRLRYAEWYYGPQERFLAAYTLKIKQKTRLYDQLSLVGAYQFVQESRHNRDFQDDWRSHRTESLDIFSFNLDATKKIRPHHSLSYGTEFVWNGVRSVAEAENIRTGETEALDTRYPDGGSEYQTAALYLTHKWKLTERWSLTQGVRLTRVQLIARFADTRFYAFPYTEIAQPSQSLSGSIGTVYQGTKGWQLRASLANGFRAPNLDDVAKVFDSQPGNVVVPNPELGPEYTYNLEVGIEKAWDEGIRLGVTGFATYYDNAIVVRNFSIAGADSLLYEGVLSQVQANVNAQEAYYLGFHQFVAGKWGKWQVSHRVSFTYGQSFEAQGSVPMDHVPPLFGQGMVAYENRRWRFEATGRYQTAKNITRYSPRDLGDLWYATPEGSPAWWVLHLKTSFQLHPTLRLQAGIDNLLDRHYRPYSSRISAPGRNFSLALRGQW
jgi:hemoglobin/transferrin/lactoferrin receptor protein